MTAASHRPQWKSVEKVLQGRAYRQTCLEVLFFLFTVVVVAVVAVVAVAVVVFFFLPLLLLLLQL